MSRVLVLGGSDQGRQVIDAFASRGEHAVVGVLDGNLPVGTDVAGHRVIGSTADLAACAADVFADGFVVAIGDNFSRSTIYERALSACAELVPVSAVHAAAVVARDAVVGAGSILLAGSIVSNGCTVGLGVLLGTAASIDHDCVVGDFASLGPGAHTGGTVTIGEVTAIGLGASIVHRVRVGDHTVVGAGAVVLDDLPDRAVAYGVPARVGRTRAPGEPYL